MFQSHRALRLILIAAALLIVAGCANDAIRASNQSAQQAWAEAIQSQAGAFQKIATQCDDARCVENTASTYSIMSLAAGLRQPAQQNIETFASGLAKVLRASDGLAYAADSAFRTHANAKTTRVIEQSDNALLGQVVGAQGAAVGSVVGDLSNVIGNAQPGTQITGSTIVDNGGQLGDSAGRDQLGDGAQVGDSAGGDQLGQGAQIGDRAGRDSLGNGAQVGDRNRGRINSPGPFRDSQNQLPPPDDGGGPPVSPGLAGG